MIPIFCLNLPRATERKNKIEREWIYKLGLDIVFWKAYDRRDILNKQYIYAYDKKHSISRIGRELSSGELACCTSYCQLLEYCINNNFSEIILMEDDISPLFHDKYELISAIVDLKKEFPLSHMAIMHNINPMMYTRFNKKSIIGISKKNFSLCKIAPYGNQFLYVTNTAMRVMYEILKQMIFPADWTQRLYFCPNNILCMSNSPLAYHEWYGNNSTTYIHENILNKNRIFIP